jgi:hypothetical protein
MQFLRGQSPNMCVKKIPRMSPENGYFVYDGDIKICCLDLVKKLVVGGAGVKLF